jgi:DNA-directed RNA polymerase subunit RPC12/RpoP
MSQKTTRCTPCGAEFTDEEILGANACPTCGSKSVPMSISKDRQITINEHELRILGIWASEWAERHDDNQMRKSLGGIFHRIRKQIPGITLSMAEEVQQVADTYGSTVTTAGPDGVVQYTPRPKN